MLKIGQTIDGYEILDVLGRGGMGVVYKARDTALHKFVAIKAINPMLVEDERFLSRFKSEGIAMARLEHPNIVGVKALRHIDDHLFLVMDFVAGGTVADHIEQEGALPWEEALPLMKQALSAMQYAHDARVIHRDIKPRNLLLTRRKAIKVTDFGLAKVQEATSESRIATRTGFTGGTIYYMPPEQLVGLSKVDHRGDIYSLGMTFYEMLAGRVPFDTTSSEFAILKAIDAHDFLSLDEVSDVPAELVRIIMKAIEREVGDRYQQASEMLADLEAFERHGDQGTPVKPVPAPVPTFDEKLLDTQLNETPALERTVLLSDSAIVEEPSGDSAPSIPASRPTKSDEPAEARRSSRRLVPVLLGGVALAVVAVLVYMNLFSAEPEAVEQSLVSIQTEPTGVDVYLGQQHLGTTPLRAVTLPMGAQALRLQHADYLTLDTTVTIAGSSQHDLYFTLAPVVAESEQIADSEKEEEDAPPPEVAVVERRETPQVEANLEAEAGDPVEDDPSPALVPERPVPGSLVLNSEPLGAEVFRNGTRIGQTPYRATLPPGSYTFVLRKEGYAEGTETVTVESGRPSTVTVNLEQGNGTLWVNVRPYGDVIVNGDVKAENILRPFEEEVQAGTYRVEARHPTFGRWEKTVEVQGGERQQVIFNFNEQVEITVTTLNATGAEVFVDGEATGRYTPCDVVVMPGERRIEVRKPGFRMTGSPAVLMLDSDRAEPIRFELEPTSGNR